MNRRELLQLREVGYAGYLITKQGGPLADLYAALDKIITA